MNKHESTSAQSSTSRRDFLKLAGAAPLVVAGGGLASAETSGAKKPGGKVKFKLGMASYTLRKFNVDQALDMTKRLGLEYICFKSFHLPLDASPELIADTVKKVQDAGLILYGGGVITMRKPEEVDGAFHYAKAAGMKTIVGAPAPEMLPAIENKVRQYDIQVAIHNHGPGDKVWPTPQTAYEKIKGLDKRIGLCVDIGHTVRYGEDLVKTIHQCADRILDFHGKDVTEATAKGRACPAGRGVIDLPAFFQAVIDIGYGNVVALEYEADAENPLPGCAESIGYFRGILSVIG